MLKLMLSELLQGWRNWEQSLPFVALADNEVHACTDGLLTVDLLDSLAYQTLLGFFGLRGCWVL